MKKIASWLEVFSNWWHEKNCEVYGTWKWKWMWSSYFADDLASRLKK